MEVKKEAAVSQDQNDALEGVTSDIPNEKEIMNGTDQENDAEDDEFGDFDGDVSSSKVTEIHQTEDDPSTEPASDATTNDDLFGDFSAPPDSADAMDNINSVSEGQLETAADAFDDPFGHLSPSIDSCDAEKQDAEPESVNENTAKEVNAAVSGEDSEASSPEDVTGYYSSHTPALKESGSSALDSESGQESAPENDAGYFSAVDATASGDDDNDETTNGVQKSAFVDEVLPDAMSEDSSNDVGEENMAATEATLEPSEVSASPSEEQPVEKPPTEIDDTTAEKEDMVTSTVEVGAEAEDDENIGDFSSFRQNAAIESTDTADGAEATGESSENVDESSGEKEDVATSNAVLGAAAEEEEDDDFGDFSSFEQNAATKSSDADSIEVMGDSLEKNDTTGVVDASQTEQLEPAPVDVAKVEAANEATTKENADVVEEDDFGDFGSFEQGGEAFTTEENDLESSGGAASPEEEVEEEDDFGDFGSFEQANDAPVQTETPQVAPPVQPDDNDEDFGDFGDFTDFASETPGTAAAGETSASDSAVVETKPTTSHDPVATVADPIISKAENIFSKVFRYDERFAVESDQDATERVAVKVNSALDEADTSDVDATPSEWFVGALASVVRGAEHLDKRGPVAVANNYSDHPYAHFTVPVCGLPVTRVDIDGRLSSTRRRPTQTAEMSAFCEIERVVGPSFSAESADSSVHLQPSTRAQQSTGTVVELPPLKSDKIDQNGSIPKDDDFADFQSSDGAAKSMNTAGSSSGESNGNNGTLSQSAKQFLQQIPDLSFMLKSTLSLPKKS